MFRATSSVLSRDIIVAAVGATCRCAMLAIHLPAPSSPPSPPSPPPLLAVYPVLNLPLPVFLSITPQRKKHDNTIDKTEIKAWNALGGRAHSHVRAQNKNNILREHRRGKSISEQK